MDNHVIVGIWVTPHMTRGVHLLQDYLVKSAHRHPHKIALVCGDHRVTYAELERHANALATALSVRGISRGDRIVVFAGNSVEAVIAFWAVLKANAVVSIINPTPSPDRLAYFLNDLRAKALITVATLADVFIPAAVGASYLQTVIVSGHLDAGRAGSLPEFTAFADVLGNDRMPSDPSQPLPRHRPGIDNLYLWQYGPAEGCDAHASKHADRRNVDCGVPWQC